MSSQRACSYSFDLKQEPRTPERRTGARLKNQSPALRAIPDHVAKSMLRAGCLCKLLRPDVYSARFGLLPHNHCQAAELNQNKNSTTVIGQFQTANDPIGSSVGLVASPYGNASQCQRVAITNFVGRKDRFFLSSHPVTYAIRGSYRDCSALVDLLFGVAVSPTKAKGCQRSSPTEASDKQ